VLVEAVIKRTEPNNKTSTDCSGLLVDLPHQTAVHCVSMRRLRRRQTYARGGQPIARGGNEPAVTLRLGRSTVRMHPASYSRVVTTIPKLPADLPSENPTNCVQTNTIRCIGPSITTDMSNRNFLPPLGDQEVERCTSHNIMSLRAAGRLLLTSHSADHKMRYRR
jgi:hypothetical protein